MKTLSYTQEYFLCAINNKGNIPALDITTPACLLAGGIMELLNHGYITRVEKDKLVAGKTWDDGLPYLKPLYEKIVSSKKPLNAKGIADSYMLGTIQKSFTELFSAIGVSVVEAGQADEVTKQGIVNEKTKYIPKAEAVTKIIEKVRAEFLENGTITEETLCLASLLDKGELIRNYFSKVERDIMKKRMKEVRESDAYASVKEIIDYVVVLFVAAAAH